MHALYLISVWIHILAATVWIGGMLFLVLVVVPWLRKGGSSNPAVFLRESGVRFRNVAWTCFVVLVVTGTFNLWVRGVRLSDFGRTEWLQSAFGETVLVKLGAFLLVLLVSAVHDFLVGPRATTAISLDARSSQARTERRRASVLGRINVLLGLVILAAAVMLVRGVPW